MSYEMVVCEKPAQVMTEGDLASPATAMEKVVEAVQRDCQADAERYLEESDVPHGGE